MRRLMTDNERQRSKQEIHEARVERKKMEVLQEFFAKNGAN
jgi:hypothetical protein